MKRQQRSGGARRLVAGWGLVLGLGGLLAVLSPVSAEEVPADPALMAPLSAEEHVLGEGVRLAETSAITDILADPRAWAGRQVRVEGKVTEVCKRRGCWMSLTAADGRSAIRIKVDDGVIVFPLAATGRWAAAEGKVELLELDRETYESWLRHLAEEQGEAFDPAAVGDGPYHLVQIRGAGAVIAPAS